MGLKMIMAIVDSSCWKNKRLRKWNILCVYQSFKPKTMSTEWCTAILQSVCWCCDHEISWDP
jgi:hypothetical protein